MACLMLSWVLVVCVSNAAERARGGDRTESSGKRSPQLKKADEVAVRCQDLFTKGKEDEAMALGLRSLDVIAAGYEKGSVSMGFIKVGESLISVRLNIPEQALAGAKQGPSYPYSFDLPRSGQGDKTRVRLDFEIDYQEGKPVSAGIVRVADGARQRLPDIKLSPDAKFSVVKAIVESIAREEMSK